MKTIRSLSYRSALGPGLAAIENPARYLGGEFGARQDFPARPDQTLLSAICFPDMYEIGMSNTALKLIYQMLNGAPGQWCGRSFVPAADMEDLLRRQSLPLCTLEAGVPLADLDVVAITVGFELSATNILTMLDLGGIPLEAAQRGEDHPLVIGGGPAFTNPAPFGRFFDAVVIGEAEACLPGLMESLRQLKLAGWTRQAALDILDASPHVWRRHKTGPVRRAVWNGFADEDRLCRFPVPNLKVIQDYASLEIMRGCPQGCRFCHAGIFYRPYRQKAPEHILREAARQISGNGYRDISLASLSSGDYPGINQLYHDLNQTFAGCGVSFALPSLKVNSFTLPLLEEMSRVKKSGLTFAVETPTEAGQVALNKTVGIENTLAIMREAKALGWKAAKLYFMTGLPFGSPEEDCEGIRELVLEIRRQVGINLNISIGTFVPKPHTPFQWAPQCEPERAFQAFLKLKQALRPLGVQVSYQNTFSSLLEGLIARGDDQTGALILAAWQKGARFDAWDDRLQKAVWDQAIAETGLPLKERLLAGFGLDEPLPWSGISMGLSPRHLQREYGRSRIPELSPRCLPDCHESCGVCGKEVTVVHHEAGPAAGPDSTGSVTGGETPASPLPTAAQLFPPGWESPVFASGDGTESTVHGMLFAFSKLEAAAWLPHLALTQVLERSFLRAGLPYRLSPGFSPHPVMELGQALSLGIPSLNEFTLVQLGRALDPVEFMERLNPVLPPGLRIRAARPVLALKDCRRCPSLGSVIGSSSFLVRIDAASADAPALSAVLEACGTRLEHRQAALERLAATLDRPLPPGASQSPAVQSPQTILEANFPSGSAETWFVVSPAGDKPTMRSLLEPAVGKDWQTRGISCLRLDMAGRDGELFSAYGDWAP